MNLIALVISGKVTFQSNNNRQHSIVMIKKRSALNADRGMKTFVEQNFGNGKLG
ncbi:hypothetical protein [uncultured Pseudodesulfovibrio sp.]|uniref:hypothetical protein n=1 Tax=uncultured Pseudodesulfovibrio sp. TaxID=2035858 RepID=UPI0029C8713E|nr:hypothetical protein [uncultured Pseudodesulfovibrio sp.]